MSLFAQSRKRMQRTDDNDDNDTPAQQSSRLDDDDDDVDLVVESKSHAKSSNEGVVANGIGGKAHKDKLSAKVPKKQKKSANGDATADADGAPDAKAKKRKRDAGKTDDDVKVEAGDDKKSRKSSKRTEEQSATSTHEFSVDKFRLSEVTVNVSWRAA
jgi:hypothetical protein